MSYELNDKRSYDMTKFLQRVQLALWAVAIIVCVVFQLMDINGELRAVPAIATYIFNLVGVVLVLVAGYCVMAQRKHRVLRLVAVNLGILCTEALYFMMMPTGSTMMYCFLLCLLLSLAAYPIKEPKKDAPVVDAAEDVAGDATDGTSVAAGTDSESADTPSAPQQ